MWFQFISSSLAALLLAWAAAIAHEPIAIVFLSIACAMAYLSHNEDLPHKIRLTAYALALGLYLIALVITLGGLL